MAITVAGPREEMEFKMKAAVFRRFGGPEVVNVDDVRTPEPRRNEIQVAIYATSVNSADSRLRSLDVPRGFGFLIRLLMGPFVPRKRILGVDGAGKVTAIGSGVTHFRVGDRVAVCPGIGLGCHAEFICMRETGPIAKIPDHLQFSDVAGLLFGGSTALLFLRDKVKLHSGHKILIIGASGAVGVSAVQIARHLGAEVTAVCSATNADLVRELGANAVIDYRSTAYLKQNAKYDVIFDCVGATTFSQVRALMLPNSNYAMLVAGLPELLSGAIRSLGPGPKVVSGDAQVTSKCMTDLLDLAAKGKIRSVIERKVQLEQIRDAHRLVDSKRKKGAVVVLIRPDSDSALRTGSL